MFVLSRREAQHRESAWWKGEWTDELVYATLAEEWTIPSRAVRRREAACCRRCCNLSAGDRGHDQPIAEGRGIPQADRSTAKPSRARGPCLSRVHRSPGRDMAGPSMKGLPNQAVSQRRAAPTDGDLDKAWLLVAALRFAGSRTVWETSELNAHEPLPDPFIPVSCPSPTR